MNKHLGQSAYMQNTLGERLLTSTAIKLELPPSQFAKMVQRKQAIENHLQREESPLKDLIRIFYQQGSVAIGATIRAKFRDEGFDIDIIVELLIEHLTPAEALDILFTAVRGAPGSRYFDCTERQTRCVTVHYSDEMHLDLSPSVLLNANDPRRSHIFHSKPEEPRFKDKKILTNSFGFAEAYNDRCPVDQLFAEEYGRKVRAYDTDLAVMMKDADSVPAPEHSTVIGGKSSVTVALQLIKRNRVIRWQRRNGQRMPASVMLSCLTYEVAEAGRTISENLEVIATHILARLENAKSVGQLIIVENPCCAGDFFTDRWPENHNDQNLLIGDMRLFLNQLKIVTDEQRSLRDRAKVLEKMFGETVTQQVVKEFADEAGGLVTSGKHLLGAAGGILATPLTAGSNAAAKPNTFYGATPPIQLNSFKKPKTLDVQVNAMARRWPQFQPVRGLSPNSILWFGELSGLEQSYQISIEYGLPVSGDSSLYRTMPVVRVLRPSLKLNFNAPEERPLPHVFFEGPDWRLSPLCLFDPKADEWSSSMLIANTTIPWTARWLACYEIWEATGRWVGGGRHDIAEDQNNAA